MIADLDESAASELPTYDLCIVGSGPAGATLAAELEGTGLRICVLESGKEKATRHGDSLRHVESEGIHIKEYSRERRMGGASTTWAGLSSPLDQIDLAQRAWLAHSGWPLTVEDLRPLYAEAAERYRFAPLELYGEGGFDALRAGGEAQPDWESLDEKVFLAADPPQNYAREQRKVYEGGDVDLWLDATLLRLESEGEPLRAVRGLVRTSGGRQLELQARAFVLATGGLENARLLLNSRDACPSGLGNERDQVGRFLMNHPKNYHGLLHLARPLYELPYFFGCLVGGFAGYAGLRLCDAVQRERELLNSYVRFEPLFPWSDNDGVESLVYLVKRSAFLFRRWKASRRESVVSLRDYSETGDDSDLQNERKSALDLARLALNVPLHAPSVSRYLYYRLRKGARPLIRTVRLRNFIEMQPDPENRVTLSGTLDPYGEPVPRVRHSCSALDRRSLLELHEVLEEEVARTGLGRLESDLQSAEPWPITQDASHHMGTTRMGLEPGSSVVDVHQRLHGVQNVWAAGASVFPTSGCANPTFTLVALSIRLARHLQQVLPQLPATATRTP